MTDRDSTPSARRDRTPSARRDDTPSARRDDTPSRQLKAVRWILEGARMTPPVKRTQMAAAEKFGIAQAVVSLGMKKYIREGGANGGIVPDGRKGWPRPDSRARFEEARIKWIGKDE